MSAEQRWEGYVESLKQGVVRGWAWDREQPLAPIEVSLWDDRQNQVAVVKADELRIGLLKKGNGRHGFTYSLPEPWKDLRVVFAKFAGTDLYLRHCPRFRDDWEPVPPQTGLYAQPRDVTNLGNCDFYHTMDLPGYGTVEGGWDLRGTAREYLGGVSFKGKRVLDVGKASGFLTFHMESQGAEVVAYDLSEYHGWDVIPYAAHDSKKLALYFRSEIWRINNGFWLAHRAYQSQAKLVYGTVYAIPREIGPVDIALVSSILLHLRDPFYALENALRLTRETVIVTEPIDDNMQVDSGEARMIFNPDAQTGKPNDTWWTLSPELVKRFLAVLGFEDTTVSYHTQVFEKTRHIPHYTLVARRTKGRV